MAAIATTALTGGKSFKSANPATLTGATLDTWLLRPGWARYLHIVLTFTSIATSSIISLLECDPIRLDDSFVTLLKETAAFTTMTTSTATYVVDIGPGVSGIADDVTMAAAADSYAALNAILPDVFGIRHVAVGASVYTLSATFCP